MNKMSKERKDAIELFINGFNIITDCLYNGSIRTSKADEYYIALVVIKGFLEDIYYDE